MSERPKILEHWDEVQHDPLTLPPDDFDGMSTDDAVELIKEWFFENFEDPVHSTPYESAEGGYQYIWGGPYNTRDIIENIFADSASEELIRAAIEEIQSEGLEWVPNSRRLQPPDEEDPPEPPLEDASTLHAKMLRRISSLEKAMAQLPDFAPGSLGGSRRHAIKLPEALCRHSPLANGRRGPAGSGRPSRSRQKPAAAVRPIARTFRRSEVSKRRRSGKCWPWRAIP
jgi:hypothetical protein